MTLCKLFDRIVSQVYTIDSTHTPENRITGMLAPTADRILEMFLSQEDDIGRPFEALFYACYLAKEVFQSQDNGLERQVVVKAEKWCLSALALAERVVRTRSIVRYHSIPLGFQLTSVPTHLALNYKSTGNSKCSTSSFSFVPHYKHPYSTFYEHSSQHPSQPIANNRQS